MSRPCDYGYCIPSECTEDCLSEPSVCLVTDSAPSEEEEEVLVR